MQVEQMSLIENQAERLSQYVSVKRDATGEVVGVTIIAGEFKAELDAGSGRRLIAIGRFIGECACKPVINDPSGFVLVTGEDDCSKHRIEMEE
jgi:hypothetical protein